MYLTKADKNRIRKEVLKGLSFDRSIKKIVLFGSFVESNEPEDIDLAIFSESASDYLSLAMEYRRRLRGISREIPVDVIPIRISCENISFMEEITRGEVIYEKRD